MEVFNDLVTRQTEILNEITTKKADYDNLNPKNKRVVAAKLAEEIKVLHDEHSRNNQVIVDLNKEGTYDERSYFKKNKYADCKAISVAFYNKLKATVEAADKAAADKTKIGEGSKDVPTEVNESDDDSLKDAIDEPTVVEAPMTMNSLMMVVNQLMQTVQDQNKIISSQLAGRGGEATRGDNLVEVIQQLRSKKFEQKFPDKFPSDLGEVPEFFARVKIYEDREGQQMQGNLLLDLLKRACDHNKEAKAVIAHLALEDENYEPAKAQLKERFMANRNMINVQFDKINKMSASYERGGQATHIRSVLDTALAVIANVKRLCKNALPASATDQDVDAAFGKASMAYFAWRLIDDSTKAFIISQTGMKSEDLPTFEPIKEGLQMKIASASFSDTCVASPKATPTKQTAKVSGVATSSARGKCLICGMNNHATKQCRKLVSAATPNDRFKIVKEHNLCKNCLSAKYKKCNCEKEKKGNCTKCNYLHHELLHDDDFKPKQKGAKIGAIVAKVSTVGTHTVAVVPTLLVRVMDRQGMFHPVRAMADSGAQAALITYKIVDLLGIPKTAQNCDVFDYAGHLIDRAKHEVKLKIVPHFKSDATLEFPAQVVNRVGGRLPSSPIRVPFEDSDYPDIILADPTLHRPGGIDMILGTKEVAAIKRGGFIAMDGANLEETTFGYTFAGSATSISSLRVEFHPSIDMNELRKIFEEPLQDEEKKDFVATHYQQTVKRDDEGYIVRIPFKSDVAVGESKKMTVARIRSMLRKLPDETRREYVNHCRSWLTEGHMVKISDLADAKPKNYFANFGHKNPKSLTTPVRIVFTCDQRTSNGKSINDCQYVGPKRQNDLPSVIMNFRLREVAVTADISKMYLRIRVPHEDAMYQCTFIPESDNGDPNGPLVEVAIPKVVFGMKSAPYLALETLKQVDKDKPDGFEEAGRIIREDTIVDDIATSFDTVDEAARVCADLQGLLKKANFPLTKFAATHDEALRLIPPKDRLSEVVKTIAAESESIHDDVRVLGLQWDKKQDILHYKVNFKEDVVPTMRVLLSVVAKIYDPVGFLAPVIAKGKFCVQRGWRAQHESNAKSSGKAITKIDWDKPIEGKLADDFKDWQGELQLLENIKVPRWLKYRASGEADECAIIGYCDASKLGYGYVLYLRVVHDGEVSVVLIGAKSKNAPIIRGELKENEFEDFHMPRLETMGACLLAQGSTSARTALHLPDDVKIILFTDAMIVLARIQGELDDLPVFERNRVREIHKHTKPSQWYHVPTKENPADLVSRGLNASELVDNELWWNGPPLIHQLELQLEQKRYATNKSKKAPVAFVARVTVEQTIIPDLEKISKWSTTLIVMGYLIRALKFVIIFKEAMQTAKRDGVNEPLSGNDIQEAREFIIKAYQSVEYAYELKCIQLGANVEKGPLKHMSPFVDSQGILRVGGRLENAWMPKNEKHPAVLPPLDIPKKKTEENVKTMSLTKKLIIYAHEKTLHGGERKTMAYLQQAYHIPNMRNSVRWVIFRCVRCATLKARPVKQMMGQVPSENVRQAPPFYHIMIDYAGPITVLNSKGRKLRRNKDDELTSTSKNKGWIMVIVCKATSATHLELVESLEPKDCLEAFIRFTSVRGIPQTVKTDNATTFTAAAKILEKEAREQARKCIVQGHRLIVNEYRLEELEMFDGYDCYPEWSFIPPLAPNFAGKVEAAVKQVKQALVKTIGETKLTYSGLMTVLKRDEAALNSRPLGSLMGPKDERYEIITPGHFLIGRALNSLPLEHYATTGSLSDRQKHMMRMANHFYKSYFESYVQSLRRLPKWCFPEENLQKGEIVLLREKDTPSIRWKKARVIETHPGDDDLVRVVTTKKASQKEMKRSVRDLVRLPILTSSPAGEEAAQGAAEAAKSSEVKDDNKKDEPRRSPRIKAKANSTSIPGKTLLGAMLCMMMFALVTSEVSKINDTGILFIPDQCVYIRTGTFHVSIDTRLNPKEDLKRVNAMKATYTKACDQATAKFKEAVCSDLVQSIVKDADYAIAQISLASNPKTGGRVKRETRGVMSYVWEFLFGSNDATGDLTAAHSMGVVHHATEAFVNVEKQLVAKQYFLEARYSQLVDDVNRQEAKVQASANVNALNLRLIELSEGIIENLRWIAQAYEDVIGSIKVTEGDLKQILASVEKSTRNKNQVPPVQLSDIRKLMKIEHVTVQETITVLFNVPMVGPDYFEKVLAIPMPNEDGQIADVDRQVVVYNQRLQVYMKEVKLQMINNTHAITKEAGGVFNRVSEDDDCVIKAIMTGEKRCNMKPLPERYDEWMSTPAHNVFAYYSNQNKELMCPNFRRTIPEKAGTIKIPNDCHVMTTTKVIHPSADGTAIVRKIAKFDLVDARVGDLKMGKGKLTEISKGSFFGKVDDSELQAVLEETSIVGLSWWTVGMVSASAMGGLVVVVALAWLGIRVWTKARRPRNEEVPKDADRVSIELQSINLTNME